MGEPPPTTLTELQPAGLVVPLNNCEDRMELLVNVVVFALAAQGGLLIVQVMVAVPPKATPVTAEL